MKFYNLKRTNLPSNLTRISEFEDGDFVVTPHLPEYGKLSIHIVDRNFPDCYRFEPNDKSHQNHRIKLKRSIGLDGEISIRHESFVNYHALLRYLRYPVLPIPQFHNIFLSIVQDFDDDRNQKYGTSTLEEYLFTLAEKVNSALIENLRKISPAGGEISFEKLCERLLKSNGYEIVRHNWFDKQGGDVDIVCKRSRDELSIFEGGESLLYVQVKKHSRQTDANAVEQLIRMMEGDSKASGCVMSSADNFSREAMELAENNGIVLLDKKAICSLLLPLLSDFIE